MKKILKNIVCLTLSALLLCASACTDDTGSTPPWVKPEKTVDPSDFISANQTITFTADEYLTVADGELQGGCTDGTYYYVALGDAVEDVSTINKYNIATKELTATYGAVKGKFSDLTYNPVTKEIIAAKSGAENTKISVFNAETMKLKSTKTMPVTTYSIAYDHYENCYWVLTSNLGIAKLNANFKKVGNPYEFVDSGCSLKGIDVDSKFIYVLLYEADKIMVYDKTGAFEREIYLPRNSQEPQNICHVGGDFYIGYDSANGGGTVYKSNMTTWQKPTADPSKSIEQDYFSTELEWVTNVKQGYTDDNVLCYVVQGGCTDGKYYYAGVIQSTKTVDDVAMIQKFDLATGELVATYHDLKVGHCNDMTYNPNTNEIIVSHALPTEITKMVSIFDAEDFTLKETVELTVGTGAISYDPYENCYIASNLNYVGDVRYATFVKYDLGFNEIGRTQANIGLITQKTTQNLDVDSKYIYYCQYKSNAIIVYDKTTGEHVKDIILPKQTNEAEHVFHVGETLYVGYYNQPGGTLYKVNIVPQYTEYLEAAEEAYLVPELDSGIIPQGMDEWEEENLLIISGYFKSNDVIPSSMLVTVDMTTGNPVGKYTLKNLDGTYYTGHAGGIAVSEENIYISNGGKLLRIPLSQITTAGNEGTLNIVEEISVPVAGSFCNYSDGILWVGDFSYASQGYDVSGYHDPLTYGGKTYNAWAVGYNITTETESGLSTEAWNSQLDKATPDYVLGIADKIQGFTTLGGKIVLSQSYGREVDSKILVYDNPVDTTAQSSVTINGEEIPVWFLSTTTASYTSMPMAEGLSTYDGKVLILYESGATFYKDGGAVNPTEYVWSLDIGEQSE